MNYESIILELMTRVQKLEAEVSQLKATQQPEEQNPIKTKAKVTPEMINLCYIFATAVYDKEGVDTKLLAEKVNEETGMNVNTANMNIMSIIDMLNGSTYKRLLSGETVDLCLGWILKDYGKQGLEKAINALQGHIEYLNSIGNPANTLKIICKQYEQKLN